MFFKSDSIFKSDSRFHLAKKYFNGIPGTIMTFDLESKETCFSFMNKLKIIRRATNLNDNKTLIIHPHSTIYAEFSEAEKEEAGIRDTMLRLSVGIENVEDLIANIEQALVQFFLARIWLKIIIVFFFESYFHSIIEKNG